MNERDEKIRECEDDDVLLNEMIEREGRKRLILRIHKRNDCFGREGD